MYALLRRHHWSPSAYYRLGPGERLILRAFLEKEAADDEALAERMKHR